MSHCGTGRWIAALAVAVLVRTAVGQTCAPPSASVAPSYPTPNVVLQAVVDPVGGNDATASYSLAGQPYKTIGAAISALSPSLATPGVSATVRLMPGLYGHGSRHNGDQWPLIVPSGISLRGDSALTVMLDGAAMPPSAQAVSLPDPISGVVTSVSPVLVFASSATGDHGTDLVSRVSIVRADVGVVIGGPGTSDPSFGHVLFAGCRVGVQVHAQPATPGAGLHRPRFIWCTFGNNAVGAAITGPVGASGLPDGSASRPVFVNCLFKNARDLEGVPCHAVERCAFAASYSNASSAIEQPATPPQPHFDTSLYTHRDLFIGAVTMAPAADPSQVFFTDWRLTFLTSNGSSPNPAATGAIEVFPFSAANGTPVNVVFGGVTLGTAGAAEGFGTGGPPIGAGTPSGLSLGYDQAGTFVIGGTMPLTDGFGSLLGGELYGSMHFFFRSAPVYPLLFAAHLGGAAPYSSLTEVPTGLRAQPLAISPFTGAWWLDNAFPIANFSYVFGNGVPGMLGGYHWSLPVSVALEGQRVDVVLQAAYVAPNGAPVLTDAQRCFLVL